jgi:hypothetical protein
MKTRKLTHALLLFSLTCGAFGLGCELIVDFDRTKIPVPDAGPTLDASTEGGAVPDGGGAVPTEGGSPDAGEAGSTDAGEADAADAADG